MPDEQQKQAPDFTLKDQHGSPHSLADYRGKTVLLYFYPKDMTPGCTLEARGFQTMLSDLIDAGVTVIGVSGDSCDSHKHFAQKHHLNFTLLSDPEHEVCKAYGVYNEKSMFGKTFMGITRESFLINPQGVILKHYPKVDPLKHPKEVLDDIRSMA